MRLIRPTLATFLALSSTIFASSHREAPAITETPKVDGTDFYMFNSYEAGREGFVTFVANYIPLQDAYGGPNYFFLDPDAVYEIHIDNDGDAIEDLTFQFSATNNFTPLSLPIGTGADQQMVPIPLLAAGQVDGNNALTFANLRLEQNYTLKTIVGDRRTGATSDVSNSADGSTVFTKPMDNIGTKTFPNYSDYANNFVYNIDLPGGGAGRVFVGQRKDPFVVNLGEVFDLVNLNPLGPVDGRQDDLADANITSFCLEVPASFLTQGGESVIGAWMTASVPNGFGGLAQLSRLGHPLVNEVVIGVEDKDDFNRSEPMEDGQFAVYVTHPTLPALLEILFPGVAVAPTAIPRNDLVAIFLTGVSGLNQPSGVVGSEMLRLNTNVDPNNGGIPAVAAAAQNNLGVIAGDNAGFPNGRRPGDDVVDIALRAVMGVLLPEADAPNKNAPLTDGASVDASDFPEVFPYLNEPIPGSPNDPEIRVSVEASTDLIQFLALGGSDISYDPQTMEITAKNVGADRAFYRLKTTDEGVCIEVASVDPFNVKLRVILP